MKTKRVKPIVVDTPVFRSEAEEAEWWDRHQDLIADLLLKHGRRGAVPTKSISVRLPVTDIERARKLAEKRGVGLPVGHQDVASRGPQEGIQDRLSGGSERRPYQARDQGGALPGLSRRELSTLARSSSSRPKSHKTSDKRFR